MGISIQIIDEQFGKARIPAFEIEYPRDTISIEELITRRVKEEVAGINALRSEHGNSLPTYRMFLAGLKSDSAEVILNPDDNRQRSKPVDPVPAIKTAIEAFKRGEYFVILNGLQVNNLSETINLNSQNEAIFLKLTPLAGG